MSEAERFCRRCGDEFFPERGEPDCPECHLCFECATPACKTCGGSEEEVKTEHARIAEAVVADIFTNGAGQRADRLLMVRGTFPEQEIGGLGRQAVRNAVLRALRDHDERCAEALLRSVDR